MATCKETTAVETIQAFLLAKTRLINALVHVTLHRQYESHSAIASVTVPGIIKYLINSDETLSNHLDQTDRPRSMNDVISILEVKMY